MHIEHARFGRGSPKRKRGPSAGTPRRSGSVVIWLVICLGVIVGIIGLGMDGGRLMEERRRNQAAADAAALAAATQLYRSGGLSLDASTSLTTSLTSLEGETSLSLTESEGVAAARTAALASAKANGYANDGTKSTVRVNSPPQSGAFSGKVDYVEVIVTSWLPATFGAVFTREPLRVQARAVARGRPMKIGLLALQASGSAAISVEGTSSVEVVDAPVHVNSPDPLALQVTGSAFMTAPSYHLAASVPPIGNLVGSVELNQPPTPDPLRGLAAPDPADYPVRAHGQSVFDGSTAVTLEPGVYRGGISISSKAQVTLSPGIYIMDGGGLQTSGEAALLGSEVMVYNTGGAAAGQIRIGGKGKIQLSPPKAASYAGIIIFQDRSLSQPIEIGGNGNVQVYGAIYAAAGSVALAGNSSAGTDVLGSSFIVSRLQISGTGSFQINGGAGTTNSARIPEIDLVE